MHAFHLRLRYEITAYKRQYSILLFTAESISFFIVLHILMIIKAYVQNVVLHFVYKEASASNTKTKLYEQFHW